MVRALTLGALLVTATMACSSFEDDMRTICEAPNEAKVDPGDDPSVRAMKLAKHISERIRSEEAKQLLSHLATIAPDQRRAELEAAAKKVGIDDCPYLELYPPQAPAR